MSRILVIEDNIAFCHFVQECLQTEHEVNTAYDGQSGLLLAQSFLPELIICDIALPKVDGFDVLRQIQTLESMNEVAFIFISAYTDRLTVRQGMTLGADDFLTKPFSVNELLHAVRARLAKRSQRLAKQDEALEQLCKNIVTALPHELRTSIMVVEGFSELMLEDVAHGDPIHLEMVNSIHRSAIRLRRLAEKYLWYVSSFAKPVSGQIEMVHQPTKLLRSIAERIAQQCNRSFDLAIDIDAGSIQISEEILSVIVSEIVENAFKFSKRQDRVSLRGMMRGASYIIEICSQGPEITADQIAKIGGFMQFERAQREQQGIGMGLVVAKRLIELNGGMLTIKSALGTTAVTVTLPLARCGLEAQPCWTQQQTTRT